MSAANPQFENVARPAYELGWLLKALPHHISGESLNTAELVNKAAAAEDHASNACEILMDGMESVGKLIFAAGTNADFPIDDRGLASLGSLIQYLSVEMQFLLEQSGAIRFALGERAALNLPPAAPVKKGGAA